MTREGDRREFWERNYSDKSLSGIEFRDKNDRIVHFIAIKHKEVLNNEPPHRITIKMNENNEPIMPVPQTFEEKMEAKRRAQMLPNPVTKVATSNTTSSSSNTQGTSTTERAARRIVDMRRRRHPISLAPQCKVLPSYMYPPHMRPNLRATTKRTKLQKGKRGKKKVKVSQRNAPVRNIMLEPTTTSPEFSHTLQAGTSTATATASTSTTKTKKISRTSSYNSEPTPSTSSLSPVSLKELKKSGLHNESLDIKEVKLMLKSAPPGGHVVLPNGIVIKKSRRGGARIGAGRKRSRPRAGNENGKGTQQAKGDDDSSHNSSFSKL